MWRAVGTLLAREGLAPCAGKKKKKIPPLLPVKDDLYSGMSSGLNGG